MIDLLLHRRRFLQIGSLGLTGLSLSRLLRADAAQKSPARARSCILFYMCGGASHLDMFDMKPAAGDEIRGPFQPVASSVPGVSVCEHLPRLARQMHHFAQIRSITHAETNHPHAVYQMLTGYRQASLLAQRGEQRLDAPHIGSAFAQADPLPAALPKHIRLPSDTMIGGGSNLTSQRGQSAGILRASYDPMPVEISPEGVLAKPPISLLPELNAQRLDQRERLLDGFNHRLRRLFDGEEASRSDIYHEQALNILAAPSMQRAFDLEREPAALHERYGRHRQGQSLLLARRLVEAGARFITVYWGPDEQDWADGKGLRIAGNPWDTHRNHFPIQRDSLFPRFDQSLAALVEDLDQRGLLDETLVVWLSDFGRTPRISARWASRDHWPGAFTMMFAGAGVKGGHVIGRTDNFGAAITDRPVNPADLTATIFDALGVAPGTSITAAHGETHRLSPGRALHEIFA